MGDGTSSRDAYTEASRRLGVSTRKSITAEAEQKARKTGKLNPLVDPAEYGVIRLSLPRFEKLSNGLWRLTVGTPIPIETRIDTTGSMGHNVDVAYRVLPDMYELCSSVLPGCDLQIATGIFGDVTDRFVLCRPQFEMEAGKIIEQLSLMVPEKDGGDIPEDPHYGLFGAAYLTSTYLMKIGLKGYDFTVSDAPARHRLNESELRRIFGEQVFEKVVENGHQINSRQLPTTSEAVQDLLKIAHAFFFQVDDRGDATEFWVRVLGRERVVMLPSTELLPHVQAVVIGLTEGTLELSRVEDFLRGHNVSQQDARRIVRSVANIPIGAQAVLPSFQRRPKKGDLFRNKTDMWPIRENETDSSSFSEDPDDMNDDLDDEGPDWL